jgi:hypothetical protein
MFAFRKFSQTEHNYMRLPCRTAAHGQTLRSGPDFNALLISARFSTDSPDESEIIHTLPAVLAWFHKAKSSRYRTVCFFFICCFALAQKEMSI